METVVLERHRGSKHETIGETGRYWVSFIADILGGFEQAFHVFVAQIVEERVPFRTLVWPALLEPSTPLSSLVDGCVRAVLNDDTFESLALKGDDEVIVLDTGFADGSARLRPNASASKSGNPMRSWTRMSDVGFFRLDYSAPDGIIGFSCRALSQDGMYEFAVLLEQRQSFSDEILNWALERHHLKQLRNPKTTDSSSLRRFLNQGWLMPDEGI